MIIAMTNITPPIKGEMPQQLGFITRDNKPVLNFRCVDTQDTLPDLKDVNLGKSTFVIKLDNDSLISVHPNINLSSIQYGIKDLSIYIEANLTDDQLNSMKNHKAIFMRFITDKYVKYNLFVFTEQNQTDIQRVATCFSSKK